MLTRATRLPTLTPDMLDPALLNDFLRAKSRDPLTEKELVTLSGMLRGLDRKTEAVEGGVSPETIASRRKRIQAKLELANTHEVQAEFLAYVLRKLGARL